MKNPGWCLGLVQPVMLMEGSESEGCGHSWLGLHMGAGEGQDGLSCTITPSNWVPEKRFRYSPYLERVQGQIRQLFWEGLGWGSSVNPSGRAFWVVTMTLLARSFAQPQPNFPKAPMGLLLTPSFSISSIRYPFLQREWGSSRRIPTF